MRKCGLITVGILTMIASIVDIVIGSLIFSEGSMSVCNSTKEIVDTTIEQEKEYIDDDNAVYPSSNDINNWFGNYCGPSVNAYAGLSLAAGLLWLIISFLIFYFTCGKRIERFENNNNNENVVKGKPIEVHEDGITIVMDENERREHYGTPRAVTGVVTGDGPDHV